MGRYISGLFWLVLLSTLTACASRPVIHVGGAGSFCADTLFGWMGGGHVSASFRKAACEKRTWIPFTAAAFVAAADLDDDISDWAVEQNPLFGKEEVARDASDALGGGLLVGAGITAVTDTYLNRQHYGLYRNPVSANLVAMGLGFGATDMFKKSIHTNRPYIDNGDPVIEERDRESFYSGHTSSAFTSAALLDRNVASILKGAGKSGSFDQDNIRRGLTFAAGLTGWARIEGEQHYPTDVLVGAAMGNFFASFTIELMGDHWMQNAGIHFEPLDDGAAIRFVLFN